MLVALTLVLVAIAACEGQVEPPTPSLTPRTEYRNACALIRADELAAITGRGLPTAVRDVDPSECVWEWERADGGRDLVMLEVHDYEGPLPDPVTGLWGPLEGFERTAIWTAGRLYVSVGGRLAHLLVRDVLLRTPEGHEAGVKAFARLLHERLPKLATDALASPTHPG